MPKLLFLLIFREYVGFPLDKRKNVRYPNNMDTVKPSVERQPLTARGLAKQLGLRIVRITQFLTRRMQQEVLTPSQATVLTLLQDDRAWRIIEQALPVLDHLFSGPDDLAQ